MFTAFGLRNAAQALERLKDNILMGLDDVFSFLDDDGVFSKSKEQHWTHLRTLFAILTANGLALNLEKCVFAVSELDFLGHRISAAGVTPLWDNVQVILDFPKPTDCKAMQRFLGMINFYRRFLPGVAGTLRPLTAALSGNPKTLPWTPDMETAFATAKEALVLRIITQKVGDLDLIDDSSMGIFHPLVPRDLRRQVFEHLHGAAHPGRRATRRLISSRYVWKSLSTDVTAWAKACLGCQRAKVHRHVQVPPQHIPVPSRRFSHIHVDLVGPLPASKGFTYLFTIIDRTSRWPEAIPIAATTTVDCAYVLFQG